ncbi:MAG: hypothetical protein J6Y57_08900 [Lachnospiraceae bacterium]|nr:hypothetical protein [Lachnospiraceae bacterium]
MLKKRLLTRLTRLGLAMYVMTYCMSFTVCAAEDPIADLSVAGTVEVLAATETPESADPETVEPLAAASDGEDATVPEEAEPAQEDEADLLLGDSIDELTRLALDQSELTVTAGGTYQLQCWGIYGEGNHIYSPDPGEFDVFFAEDEDAEVEDRTVQYAGATFNCSRDEEDLYETITLSIPDNMEACTFYLIAEREELSAACKIVVYLPVTTLGMIFNGSAPTGSVKINNPADPVIVTPVSADPENMVLDADRLSYSVYEGTDEVGSGEGAALTKLENGSCSVLFENITETRTFDIIATYDNDYTDADGVEQTGTDATATIRFEISNETEYCYEVEAIELMPGGNLTVSDFEDPLTFVMKASDPEGALLDPDRISWGIAEPGSSYISDSWHGISIEKSNSTAEEADVFFATVEDGDTVDVVAMYFNEPMNQTSSKPVTARTRLIINGSTPSDDLEVHMPEQTMKIDVYKTSNKLPFVIRSADVNASSVADYEIYDAFIDSNAGNVTEMIDLTISDDGYLDFYVPQSVINNKTALATLLKSKFKATLWFELEVEGKGEMWLESEEVSFSFTGALPTAKDVKPAGTLTFDAYFAGAEGLDVSFTGVEVDKIMGPDSRLLPKGLFVDEATQTINSTSALPAKGKGSIKVLAFIEDERYNLPENYNVTVAIPYTIANSEPFIKLNKTSGTANPLNEEYNAIGFETGDFSEEVTEFKVRIFDSKNNEYINGTDESPLAVVAEADPDDNIGMVGFMATPKAAFGQKYKLLMYPENKISNRTGAAKTITVSIPTEKNAKNPSFTLKGKGALDASVPESELVLTINAKNFNPMMSDPKVETFVINKTVKTNITDILGSDYDPYAGEIYLWEDKAFDLLEKGYAGMQIETTVTLNTTLGKVNATYKGKIAQSVVAPKLNATAVTINPDYDDGAILFKLISPEDANVYDYTVELSGPRGLTPPFEGDGNYTNASFFDITPVTAGMSSFYGKTCTVKITPMVFDSSYPLKAKPVTAKITVLDPAKANGKPKVSAKVTGSIDNIRFENETYAEAEITVKNVFDPYSHGIWKGIDLVNITTKVKNQVLDMTDLFDVDTDDNMVWFFRKEDEQLPVGTYQANMLVKLLNCNGTTEKLPVSCTFKVVRGKSGGIATVVNKLINRDYERTVTVRIEIADQSVDEIAFVSLDSAFADVYRLEEADEGVYELGFVPGYVEKQKNGKPIVKAVTKTVPIYVYYPGSDTPDKYSVKVVTNP